MENFDWARELYKAIEEAARETENDLYLLKPEVIQRVKIIENILHDAEYTVQLNAVANAVDISVLGYVFDSCFCDLKCVFENVDRIMIDALEDGRVSIEMRIVNAAEIIRRK